MSLSSLIVQREIASIREIEEALARQVLYGGDFVTNLFEVSQVDEETLMPIVAESFGLEPAPIGELPRAPSKATRLVAADVVSEKSIAPLEVGKALVVAVAEPLSADAAQELAFALALPIEQRIAPLFRIRQALARDYGVPLDKRTARLITKVVNHQPGVSSTYPPPFEPSPVYRVPPRPPTFKPPPKHVLEKQALDLRQTLNTVQGTLVRKTEIPPPRPIKRHRGPLTSDIAKAELDAAVDRDVVFDLLFEFARQFFDYTAVFIVQGEVAEGRDAFGDGAARDKVARLRVPFDAPNLLATAHGTKQFVRARPSRDGLDQILMADLGRDGTSECVVFPIIVRKRVVALLFGDGGASGIDVEGVAQVNTLIGSAASAFERVIMRRKLKGGEAAHEAAAPAGRKISERNIPVAPSAPMPPRRSDRPTSEEGPIKEILAERPRPKREFALDDVPATTHDAPATTHDPFVGLGGFSSVDPSVARSDRPPPANLLAVRRPSGAPIPREEPPPQSALRGETKPPSERGSQPRVGGEKRTKSQALKRAEAPRLEFGVRSSPSVSTEDIVAAPRRAQSPLAQTLVSEVSPFEDTMPSVQRPLEVTERGAKASVPAPSAPLAPPTDLSPQPIFFPQAPPPAPDVRPQAIVPKITIEEDTPAHGFSTTLTSAADLPMFAAVPEPVVASNPAPITPLVVVTPDQEIKPIPIESVLAEATPRSPVGLLSDSPDSPNGPEPVLALSQRKNSGQAFPATRRTPDPRAMPLSEQQISVPAHRPPSSRLESATGLPSVIVDVAVEYASLVARVIETGSDEEAEASLLRAGGYAMPAIMARFPGPIVIDKERLDSGALPRVAECGPVIRLIASQRRSALPFVLALVEQPDVDTRFWATYLLTELVYPESIESAVARTFDDEERVRRAARAAARALAEAHPQPVIDRLADIALRASIVRRIQAIEALAETREPIAVPALLPLLADSSDDIVSSVRAALVFLTQQDFGRDAERWAAWWQENSQRHRLEWLIDALMHDQRAIRGSASEELRLITKEYFGYYDDLPKRERERAQARYREWWESIGRVRFSRAANRGTV